MTKPSLPPILTQVVALGFQKSKLDLALSDALAVYRKYEAEEQRNIAMEKLLSKYTQSEDSEICLDCWTTEIEKILKRAATENATRVYVAYRNGSIHQNFVSVKLVKIHEAAAHVVYKTLISICNDLSNNVTPA